MQDQSSLPVRLGVRVGVLAFVLVGSGRVDDEDDLAADELRARALRAQHPGLVVSWPAVQQVRIAIGGERVQLVVPAGAEQAIGPPASSAPTTATAKNILRFMRVCRGRHAFTDM